MISIEEAKNIVELNLYIEELEKQISALEGMQEAHTLYLKFYPGYVGDLGMQIYDDGIKMKIRDYVLKNLRKAVKKSKKGLEKLQGD